MKLRPCTPEELFEASVNAAEIILAVIETRAEDLQDAELGLERIYRDMLKQLRARYANRRTVQ